MPLRKIEEGIEVDDAEGNGVKLRPEPAIEADDAEGHIAKAGRAPQTAKPNKDASPRV